MRKTNKAFDRNKFFDRNKSGADGSRTRVQTRNKYAFYMLIRILVFERQLVNGNLTDALVSKISLR